MEPLLLQGLNVAQKAAVTSQASVLQVLAPPGSGKTKTLTSRVAHLIAHHGYDPQNVICCTFTVKASREMRERLRALIGPELESKLIMGTFHSICRRLLVAYGYLIGIPKAFGIADSSDSISIVKRIIKRLNLTLEPKATRSKISAQKARAQTLEDIRKSTQKQADKQDFVTAFYEYENDLATSQLLDYDDLLLRCVDLLRAYPACVSNVEALLIDEFQDTNVVQFELMKLLAAKNKRITIVGDPDQSIYGFRSAEVGNLRRMKTTYPDTIVINLEENYRSASAVLKLAQRVIEQDTTRPQKKLKATHCFGTQPVLRRLPNPKEEASWIANEIKRVSVMTGSLLAFSDFAILLRSAHLSLLIEKELANSGIPYRMVGGQRFFDRAEIRILIEYLRTISHPANNQAFLAIINTPSRKIGETTIAELVRVGEERKFSVWMVAQKVLSGNLALDKNISKPAEQKLGHLVSLVRNARDKVSTAQPGNVPSMLIDLVVKAIGYEDYLKEKYKNDYENRWENVKELIKYASEVLIDPADEESLPNIDGIEQDASNGGQQVLAQFLANIVLSTEVKEGESVEDKSRVTISTIHSAKGLEWPIVFIPALYEGSIPHSRAENTDEERRLLYVAMTRAQALLTMTFPVAQSRDETPSTLSQFLPTEIHRLLASTGPLFSDKTIQDMAMILRRPAPSQEELAKSLERMSPGRSLMDDEWPADGTRKPKAMPFSESKTFGEVLNGCSKFRPSSQSGFERNDLSKMGGHAVSTMHSISSFSTSNTTIGFTTASYQMKTACLQHLTRSSSDLLPPNKKAKLSKSSSGNSTITAYLSNSAKQASMPDASTSSVVSVHLPRDQVTPKLALPALRPDVPTPSMNGIPSELSSHKLNSRSGMAQNRPMPSKEIPDNSRGRYVTLFSSSPPPPDLDERVERVNNALEGKEENQEQESEFKETKRTLLEQPSISRGVSFKSHVLSRPVNTMHSTTMSSIRQTGAYGTFSSYGKKTLGVRRTMNGWDARKNK
ncbi:DNA helicase II/ATP-dependent DNA helicase PcrA [Exophiala aquamarina CBS 119918]|uniref:DNA 3'-5' helicase n=1 Tax=Exophiala aquamarina CBS 119918 TaxID=1182545 RepID=A0A072NXJ1_9EURO|nr:DNA helicase II/ATP-dependent DNA helicase PcrA [Exophiala aquamarina CBS 119918]KEF52604.1 DNA helicase II/ATP-dependent DNA helicase PcrA [Exophiala aquamarina CBS 119918]